MKHPSNKCVVVSEVETEVRSGSKGERKNGGMERGEKAGCRCGNKNGWIRQEVRETHTCSDGDSQGN